MSATKQTLRLRAKRRDVELRRIRQMQLEASAREKPTVITSRDDFEPPSWKKRKLIMGLLMLPLCLIALVTFFDLFFHATVQKAFWKSEGFWFFTFGCLFWLSLGWVRMQPAVWYVFAHEMTHALTAKASGGKVHRMHVEEGGGFIETDKTSTLITLSPYLVPFYTVVVFAVYALLSLGVDMESEISWPLIGSLFKLKWIWIFYFFVGLTWCFHLTFTMQALATEQSDLLHNGEFFSMMLIFLINLLIVGALFISASQTLGWADVWNAIHEMIFTVWNWLT